MRETTVTKEFVEEVREYKKSGMTYPEISKITGYSPGYLRNLVVGVSSVPVGITRTAEFDRPESVSRFSIGAKWLGEKEPNWCHDLSDNWFRKWAEIHVR